MIKNVDNDVMPRFEVEAEPEDITIHVHGKRFAIDYIDQIPTIKCDGLILLTSLPTFAQAKDYVIYLVSQQLTVEAVSESETFISSSVLYPLQFLLLEKKEKVIDKHKPLFKQGDTIKLRFDGESITLKQLLRLSRHSMYINLDRQRYSIEITERVTISGSIKNQNNQALSTLKLLVNESEMYVDSEGTFHKTLALDNGVNKVICRLYCGDVMQDEETLFIYRLKQVTHDGDRLLWIEQGHNIVQLSKQEELERLVQLACKANMTAFVLDIKGIEGFVSYKQNHLSRRPYVSKMTAKTRQGIDDSHDFLDSFIALCHAMHIKVYAAVNVFAEGSYFRDDIAFPNLLDHAGQYKLNDLGVIEEHQHSEAVKTKLDKIAYVSPNNVLSQTLQLQTIEEVLAFYDVDGIVLDRCRYDNGLADFSDSTREHFLAYCKKNKIEVNHFPDDIMRIVDGVRIDGPLINVWWTFRSHTIYTMVHKIREYVDHYKKYKGKQIKLATYVGSWYEYAYIYGINWASTAFKKQYIFDWEHAALYETKYAETSYAHLLDFIIVGLYQQTLAEIEQYLLLSHYVTHEEIPIISGIALPYTENEAFRINALQLALKKSSGFMLFDHCHIKDWHALIKQLEQA